MTELEKGYAQIFELDGALIAKLRREVAELRTERVKLQDENESLRHDLREANAKIAELREHLNHSGETLLDAADRAERKQAEIEALALRLAKVEDRLTGTLDRDLGESLRRISERLSRLEQAPERFVLRENVKITDAPFPTGAATTVEEVIAQVEEPGAESDDGPPLRGDRVRLEGAVHFFGRRPIIDGWYDVIGGDDIAFQIKYTAAGSIPWVRNTDPGLKEVRRGAASLSE